jgi:hypothetical protein
MAATRPRSSSTRSSPTSRVRHRPLRGDRQHDHRPAGQWLGLDRGTQQWAINARAPYAGAGLWKNNLLTDASIFDFYNNLIDGDTKSEWQDFWL